MDIYSQRVTKPLIRLTININCNNTLIILIVYELGVISPYPADDKVLIV